MAKITIDSQLFDRAKDVAEKAGYSSVEEFVSHVLEKELSRLETVDVDQEIDNQLRGLGYIE